MTLLFWYASVVAALLIASRLTSGNWYVLYFDLGGETSRPMSRWAAEREAAIRGGDVRRKP